MGCLVFSQVALLSHALPDCSRVISDLNASISFPVRDVYKLSETLSVLFRTRSLPKGSFVSKKQAKRQGWVPGQSLWDHQALVGKSIGGDLFFNFEDRLPKGRWIEADVDYEGQKNRGGKRLVFNHYGDVYLTVDHYDTFVKVEACK